MKRTIRLAAVSASFMCADAVESQATDTTKAKLTEVRISVSRLPSAVGGAAAVVVAVDSLRLTPAAPLEAALREVPFVLVRQNSRGEVELSVRGSDSRQAAVLFDGLPLTTGWDHRSDASALPLSGVGNIIFVRGLSTLLQGPNALGGTIDLGVISDRASRVTGQNLKLSAGFDHLGTQGYQLDWSRGLPMGGGEWTFRAGGGLRDRKAMALSGDVGDQYTADDDERTNSDINQRDLYTALRYRTNGGAWIGGTYTANTLERGVVPELHISSPRFWRYPDQARHLGVVSLGTGRRKTPFGSGDMEVVVGQNNSSLFIESFLNAQYDSIVGTERGRERTTTARLLADHSLGAGELRTAFTATRVKYTETLNSAAPSEYQQNLWSSAVEVEMPIAGSLSASAGYAADASTTPETAGRTSLGRLSEWGGRVGLSTLAFSDRIRFHTSVSRRARFAALRELYSGALNRFDPNPSLKPERLVGAELGATLVSDRAQFQAVVFRHQLEDAIVRITLPNRNFRRVNRDEIRSAGLELLGGWNTGSFSITSDLTIQRLRIEDPAVSGTERKPEHQPEFRFGTDAAGPLVAGIRGRVGVNHTGKQYCVNPDLGGNQDLKSQTWLNAGVERAFALRSTGLLSRLLASLSIDNIGDSAVFDQCGLPFPGRTLRFGFSLM